MALLVLLPADLVDEIESLDVLRENKSAADPVRRALFASLSEDDTAVTAVDVDGCGLGCLRLLRPNRLTGPPESEAGANAARAFFCNAFSRFRLSDSCVCVVSVTLCASDLELHVPIMKSTLYVYNVMTWMTYLSKGKLGTAHCSTKAAVELLSL